MSITAAQPATPPLPIPLSATEFPAWLVLHLSSMLTQGLKGTLGSPRLWNLQGVATLSLVIIFLYGPLYAQADLAAQRVLEKVYSGYDTKHACWLALDEAQQQRYCMKMDRTDTLTTDTGPRLYVLVVGEAVDEAGEPNGSHATPGLVGAFVVEERQGRAEIVHGHPKIPLGAHGAAPTQWHWLKLGPADYWGWQNTAGDCHQGSCGSRYTILAPYGKTIRDLARITASFDDSGACPDTRCAAHSSSIDSTLAVDSTRINEKVFPLRITVMGRAKGKKLAQKTWTIPFDPKQWLYLEPKGWPLHGADF